MSRAFTFRDSVAIYSCVAERRAAFDVLQWTTPATFFTSMAFLFTTSVSLSPDFGMRAMSNMTLTDRSAVHAARGRLVSGRPNYRHGARGAHHPSHDPALHSSTPGEPTAAHCDVGRVERRVDPPPSCRRRMPTGAG